MDFDGGRPANGSNIDTRGMLVKVSSARAEAYYVNVYLALTVSGSLGGRSRCRLSVTISDTRPGSGRALSPTP